MSAIHGNGLFDEITTGDDPSDGDIRFRTTNPFTRGPPPVSSIVLRAAAMRSSSPSSSRKILYLLHSEHARRQPEYRARLASGNAVALDGDRIPVTPTRPRRPTGRLRRVRSTFAAADGALDQIDPPSRIGQPGGSRSNVEGSGHASRINRRNSRRPASEVTGPLSKTATTRARAERDGSKISASGGQGGVDRPTHHQKNPGGARFQQPQRFSLRGRALAVVVKDFLRTPHWTRDNTDFPPPMRQGEARLRLAYPPLVRWNGAQYERGAGGGSDPPFFSLVHHRRGLSGAYSGAINPPLGGSLPPQ